MKTTVVPSVSRRVALAALLIVFTGCSHPEPGNFIDIASGQNNTPPAPPPPAPPSRTAPPAKSDTARIRTFAEHMPAFPGGEDALTGYLSNHVHYPAGARKKGIQGTVVVQFVVKEDGTLHDIQAVGRIPDSSLATEAVRVASGMPRWIPGNQKGRRVAVAYFLPIRFVLQ